VGRVVQVLAPMQQDVITLPMILVALYFWD